MRKSRQDLVNYQNCPKNWDNLFSQTQNPFDILSELDGDLDYQENTLKARPLIKPDTNFSGKTDSNLISHIERIRAITPDTLADISDYSDDDVCSTSDSSSIDVRLNTPMSVSSSTSGPSWKYTTPSHYPPRGKNCKICKPSKFHDKKRIEILGSTIFMLDVQCRPVIMVAPLKCVRQIFDLESKEVETIMMDTKNFVDKYKLRSGSVEFNFGDWSKYKRHACMKLKLDAVEYVKKFGHMLPKKWWILYQSNLMRQRSRIMQWEACERIDYARWLKSNTTHIISGIKHFQEKTKSYKGSSLLKKGCPKRPPYIFSVPVACASVLHLQRAVESLKKSSVCILDPDTKNLSSRFEHLENEN